MKIILFLIILLTHCCSVFCAPIVPAGSAFVVMDFGTHRGAATSDIALEHAEGTASEYVIARLVEDGAYIVKDKDFVRDKLKTAGIKTVGLVDPRQLKQIAEILDVRYIIYGNVNDVSASENGTNVASPLPTLGGNVTIHTVTCHIIGRVIDTKTGFIIAAAKGEGKSKSSMTEVNALHGGIRVGTITLTQASVHNAIQKAAYNLVDLLNIKLKGNFAKK